MVILIFGELKELNMVYDYTFYNKLGYSHYGLDDARHALRESSNYPCHHRGRTKRPSSESDLRYD